MNKMIAYCGLNCEKCDAYIATKNNDQALREKTAKLWAELNNAPILPEHINCEGCRVDGVKTVFCENFCQIRQCATKKGLQTCGECPEMETCPRLRTVTSHNPEALKNLKDNSATLIRNERANDYREVENLTREAFWNVYRPGCTEHYVLHEYRNNPDFIPELDFVMEKDGMIIGHVMFSKAELVLDDGSRKQSWTFGPISIHPDYKRKGYGLKLLNYALKRARDLGVGFLCMEGNIDFYKHAGFDLASKLNIHYHDEPKDADVPYFLAQELIPGWLKGNGITEATYSPPKGYFVADENPKAFEAYEATFPKKEKLRLPGQLFTE